MQKILLNIGMFLVERFLFPLADRLWDKVVDWFNGLLAKKETNKKIDKSTGKMVDAETGEEIDDATDSVLDDL